jgi:very-short-patch-repair endonuclease
VVNDLPVTSLALTVVDCARSLPVLDALVVADGALRAGADAAEIGALLDQVPGQAGVVTARWVLDAADPGAESAPETATRYILVAGGLPAPQTQVPVQTWQKTYWADLGYPQLRIAIEYDGRAKYVGDAWFAEKRRLDAIVEAGWQVIRVTAEDLRDPSRLVARVRHVLATRRP